MDGLAESLGTAFNQCDTITILLWVLSIYPFIKHYTIVVSIISIQFSHKYEVFPTQCLPV